MLLLLCVRECECTQNNTVIDHKSWTEQVVNDNGYQILLLHEMGEMVPATLPRATNKDFLGFSH